MATAPWELQEPLPGSIPGGPAPLLPRFSLINSSGCRGQGWLRRGAALPARALMDVPFPLPAIPGNAPGLQIQAHSRVKKKGKNRNWDDVMLTEPGSLDTELRSLGVGFVIIWGGGN